jgi:hypothetical protein
MILTGWVLVAVGGVVTFFATYWHASKRKTSEIRVIVTPENHKLFRRYAEFTGRSLQDWAFAALKNSLPKNVDRLLSEAQGKNADDAFSKLDEIEITELGLPVVGTKYNVVSIRGLTRHPCLYLTDTLPPRFKRGECQGTCAAPSQVGKPCQWVAAVAFNCPEFETKRAQTKNKS